MSRLNEVTGLVTSLPLSNVTSRSASSIPGGLPGSWVGDKYSSLVAAGVGRVFCPLLLLLFNICSVDVVGLSSSW
jgi:hypothetical protein